MPAGRNILRLVFLALACSAIGGCGEERSDPDPYDLDFDIPRSESFSEFLSAYGLYQDPLHSLQPAARAIPYELSSQLFTDYALKQRLLKVPEGSAITITGNTTLVFPEGRFLLRRTTTRPICARPTAR